VPLFWTVHEIDGERRVLDAKTAKKIPKAMIGRALTAREARALLSRLA